MYVKVDVSINDVVDSFPQDEALELIKELDKEQEDWKFTIEVLTHFALVFKDALKSGDVAIELLNNAGKEHGFKLTFD